MPITQSLPPCFSATDAKKIAKVFYALEVESITDLGSYIDQNFLIEDVEGRRYVLKLHDRAEHVAVIDLQNQAVRHLTGQVAGVRFPEVHRSVAGDEIVSVEDSEGVMHYARLLSFLDGPLLKDVANFSDALLRDAGRVAGEMDRVLADFYHPAANRPDLPWDLKNASRTGRLSRYIEDPHRRRLAEFFLMKFDNEVAPQLAGLRKSVVHGDTHRYSLILDRLEGVDQKIRGVIDFGDTVYTHTVCNLAVCLSDLIVHNEDPIAAAAEVVAGYHRAFALTEDEVAVLYYLMCTRLAIYVCMAAYHRKIDPENSHSQIKERQVWGLLEKLLAVNPLRALEAFRSACGMDSLKEQYRKKGEENLEKRRKYFSGALYTHYDEPLHLTGGALQYLYDNTGRSYFDCVNNVSQWGHCHPTIVRKAQQQIARLNTNSRYVYDPMTEYAERLLATFPDPLNVVFFVNSGSEANDLAMRMARTYTGQNDMIVIDKAYHGNSAACTDISPHRIDRPGKPGLPAHVHSTLTPDTFRGAFKLDDPEAGAKYAADVQRIVEELAGEGKGVAAFIAESLIGTGGQFVLPVGYLDAVYRHVRAGGGLCIADEVQVGFGRTGEQTWCFESQGVVPDIVTMGKPIGNGHPMAAVVTTREIADAFDNGVTFFNTFGGNPVSCAFGLAVLDVLEEERLEENVVAMSRRLMAGLNRLMERYPFIADVRGQGLYIGVELVTDRDSMQPATELAGWVIEAMKARGVLLNTNGYDNNIIKIKPPLIIGEKDVDRLVDTLDAVFADV